MIKALGISKVYCWLLLIESVFENSALFSNSSIFYFTRCSKTLVQRKVSLFTFLWTKALERRVK